MSVPVELSVLQRCGGAERAEALGSLHQQLICPICLDVFTKPVVILPCQHNLCRKCANELYQPSLFQARTTMLVNSGRFRCPSCRQEVVLDRHGVYGLQRNLLVENIIDVYRQEVSKSNDTSPLPPPKPPGQLTCSDHEDEKVNIYCLSCQVPTCSLCKVFGAHKSCRVAPLTDVYQQQKDELSEGVASLVAINDKVQAFINELEKTCRDIEENCKAQKQSLCEKFDSMFSILEERRKVMSQRISSEQEEKTGHAQSLVRCYGDNVEANTKLVETAVRSMEEPDMAVFVQISRDLIAKVIAATTSCPAETLKPGYENMSHYRFSFKRQARAVHSIDFIKEEVPEEPEVQPEPEEPKHLLAPAVQNLQPVLDLALEPVREPTAASVPPPEVAAPVYPAARLVMDSAEPTAAELRPKTEGSVLNDRGAQLAKEEEGEEGEKEKEEVEEVREEAEGFATSDPVKEGSLCEHQDGMSTQQYEEREAQHDWTTQKEIKEGAEEKRDALDEEDVLPMKEEEDATFYPSWYKPGVWCNVSPGLVTPVENLPKVNDMEEVICSPQSTSNMDSLQLGLTQTEAQGAGQAKSGPQTQPQPQSQVQDSQFETEEAPSVSETQAGTQPHLPPPLSPPESNTQPLSTSYLNQQPHESLLFPDPQSQELPLSSQLHAQPYLPLLFQPHPQPESPSQSENHSQPPPSPESQSLPQPMPVGADDGTLNSIPSEGPTTETARETGSTEEESSKEPEEDEDIQGWVCLSGAVDKGFGLEESCVDFGEGSLESFDGDIPSIPPEETGPEPERSSTGTGKGNFEIRDGSLADGQGLEELEEGILGPKGPSEPKETVSRLGEGDLEAGKMNEGLQEGISGLEENSKEQEKDSSRLEEGVLKGGSSKLKDDNVDLKDNDDHSGENIGTTPQQQNGLEERDTKLDAVGLEFKKNEQDFGESSMQHEDRDSKMEEHDADNGGETTSCVSVQAVTLLFYLLAILVILQRVWAYIGCFICT